MLLDLQDWMAPEEIRALWNAIDRAGSDDVRVIFRTAGKQYPWNNRELASLREIWRRDEERSAIGFERDRSGIYGAFHCYVGAESKRRKSPIDPANGLRRQFLPGRFSASG